MTLSGKIRIASLLENFGATCRQNLFFNQNLQSRSLKQDWRLYGYKLLSDKYGDVDMALMHWKLYPKLIFLKIEILFFETICISDTFQVSHMILWKSH